MKNIKNKYAEKTSLEIATTIRQIAVDKKAINVVILDVHELSGFTDYFVILSGRSSRHVQGVAQAIDQEMSNKRMKSSDTEGLQDGQWVLLDFNDVIVHIFYDEVRSYYDLEGLWHDAPRLGEDA